MKRLDAAFPGGNDPAVVAIKADDVRAPEVQDAIVALKQKALATGQLNGPIEVEASRDNTVATVDITLAGSGTDAESQAALATLRDDVRPEHDRQGRRRRVCRRRHDRSGQGLGRRR